MMKFLKNKNSYKLIFFLAIIVYIICIFSSQQKTIASYKSLEEYYCLKLEEQNKAKEELVQIKENTESLEYIEKIAREKLDMYYPNERVYIDYFNN